MLVNGVESEALAVLLAHRIPVGMFYEYDKTCRLGTITLKESAHPRSQVPPTRKYLDVLSSRHLSYVLRKPTVHSIRGHHPVLENFIGFNNCKWKDARAQAEEN